MYLFSSFDVDVERIRGHPPPSYPRHQACFNPGQDFYFFFFLEPIMDNFKFFPIINYKNEFFMYSFTVENV